MFGLEAKPRHAGAYVKAAADGSWQQAFSLRDGAHLAPRRRPASQELDSLLRQFELTQRLAERGAPRGGDWASRGLRGRSDVA